MAEEGLGSGDLVGNWQPWTQQPELALGYTGRLGWGSWPSSITSKKPLLPETKSAVVQKDGGSSEKGPNETGTLLRNVIGGSSLGLGSGLQLQQEEEINVRQ